MSPLLQMTLSKDHLTLYHKEQHLSNRKITYEHQEHILNQLLAQMSQEFDPILGILRELQLHSQTFNSRISHHCNSRQQHNNCLEPIRHQQRQAACLLPHGIKFQVLLSNFHLQV